MSAHHDRIYDELEDMANAVRERKADCQHFFCLINGRYQVRAYLLSKGSVRWLVDGQPIARPKLIKLLKRANGEEVQ